MIFQPVEDGEKTNAKNIETKLRELLYLLVDACFTIMMKHREGDESIKPGHLNLVRQLLRDMGVDYEEALAEQKAAALRSSLSDLPDFAYFSAKYGKK